MRNYRQLVVWQKAHALTLTRYRMTASFPGDERFGLVSQMRRAGVSVASNIAEGAGRSSNTDFARFIDMAAGSCNELEYQTLLSHDLGFVSADDYKSVTAQIIEIRRMLTRLAQSMR